MKLRNQVLPVALFGALALAAVAPAAFADRGRDRDRDDRWSDSRGSRDSRDDARDGYDRSSYGWDRGGRRSERRSYYYEDPYCGRRSQYISDFKDHYGRAGHAPLILKIDIRSGDLLARYRYDSRAEEWRTWNREYRYGGRSGYGRGDGWDADRSGYGGGSDRGNYERCARCEDD